MLSDFEKAILKRPSSWAYLSKRNKYNLKGHYFTFVIAQLPEIKNAFKEASDYEYLETRLKKLADDQSVFMNTDDINNNNMDKFDEYYETMETFFKDIRERLNIKED